MKSLRTFSWQTFGALIRVAIIVSIFYGAGYGVNKLGGLLFRNEALLCFTRRPRTLPRLNNLVMPAEGTPFITGGTHIKFWDTATGDKTFSSATWQSTLMRIFRTSPSITALTLTPDQTTLISARQMLGVAESGYDIQVWDLATRQLIRTLSDHQTRTHFLAISPDSQTLISQDNEGLIKVWDLATGDLKQTIPSRRYRSRPALSPDRQTFTSIVNGDVTFWDMTTGEAIGTMMAHPSHTPLAISADNKTLLIQNAGEVKRFRDLTTGSELHTLEGSLVEYPFASMPDGKQVLVHTNNGLKLYDFLTGAEVQHFPEITAASAIVVSPDGKSFLTIDSRGRYTLWELETGAKIHELEGRTGRGVGAVTPDSQTLVHISSPGNNITLWDLTTGQRIRRFCNY